MAGSYDVAVCGGGIAGIAAALAAARQGKKTILFEKSYILGGLAMAGLITIYLPLCDGYGKQVSDVVITSHQHTLDHFLKWREKDPFTQEDIRQIIEIIKAYDYLDRVIFISFYYENLLLVRKNLPNQSAQFLDKELTDEVIARAAADKLNVDVCARGLSPESIKAAHNAGLKVNCWTVDFPEGAQILAQWGVDYITTNILE